MQIRALKQQHQNQTFHKRIRALCSCKTSIFLHQFLRSPEWRQHHQCWEHHLSCREECFKTNHGHTDSLLSISRTRFQSRSRPFPEFSRTSLRVTDLDKRKDNDQSWESLRFRVQPKTRAMQPWCTQREIFGICTATSAQIWRHQLLSNWVFAAVLSIRIAARLILRSDVALTARGFTMLEACRSIKCSHSSSTQAPNDSRRLEVPYRCRWAERNESLEATTSSNSRSSSNFNNSARDREHYPTKLRPHQLFASFRFDCATQLSTMTRTSCSQIIRKKKFCSQIIHNGCATFDPIMAIKL